MKTINVTFTKEEYAKLTRDKKDLTWREYILQKV